MGGDIVTNSGNVCFAHSHIAVDVGTEDAQFLGLEINNTLD